MSSLLLGVSRRSCCRCCACWAARRLATLPGLASLGLASSPVLLLRRRLLLLLLQRAPAVRVILRSCCWGCCHRAAGHTVGRRSVRARPRGRAVWSVPLPHSHRPAWRGDHRRHRLLPTPVAAGAAAPAGRSKRCRQRRRGGRARHAHHPLLPALLGLWSRLRSRLHSWSYRHCCWRCCLLLCFIAVSRACGAAPAPAPAAPAARGAAAAPPARAARPRPSCCRRRHRRGSCGWHGREWRGGGPGSRHGPHGRGCHLLGRRQWRHGWELAVARLQGAGGQGSQKDVGEAWAQHLPGERQPPELWHLSSRCIEPDRHSATEPCAASISSHPATHPAQQAQLTAGDGSSASATRRTSSSAALSCRMPGITGSASKHPLAVSGLTDRG